MKYFKIVLTVVLLGILLTSLAFAGTGTKNVEGKKNNLKVDLFDNKTPDGKTGSAVTGRVSGGKSSNKLSQIAVPVPTLPKTTMGITGLLSGTYTVGTPGGFFPNLETAVGALNVFGVAGPVVMELINAQDSSGPVVLGPIDGASAVNTVTFQPKAGVDVTVYFDASVTDGKGFSFMGASFVTIDGIGTGGSNLTFKWDEASVFPTDDATGSTIYMGSFGDNTTSDITIKNMTVYGQTDDANWDDVNDARFGIGGEGWDDYLYDITIDNCKFGYAFYPIWMEFVYGVTVTNNKIGSIAGVGPTAGGIYFYAGKEANISGNEMMGLQMNSDNFGYNFTGYWPWPGWPYMFGICDQSANPGSVINDNTIYDYKIKNFTEDPDAYIVLYGLRIVGSATSKPLVYNNTMSKVYSDGDETGFWMARAQNVKMYHNSFYFGEPTYKNSSGYMIIPVGGGELYNNIFYSTVAEIGYWYGTNSGSYTATASNNNCIDAVGFNVATNRAFAAPLELLSVQGDPYFLSPSLLTIDATLLSAAEAVGTPITAVPKDKFDTNVRNLTNPDAGAWEFTSPNPSYKDAAVVAIPKPDLSGAPQGLPTDVKVTVVNTRTLPVTFNLNVTITGPESYNNNVTSITLVAFKDSTLVFPQWTPSTSDPRTITATVSGDDKSVNNVMARTQLIVPVIAFGTGYESYFDDGPSQFGWVGDGDFVLSNDFTKLTGPYNGPGTSSWVTEKPTDSTTYSEDQFNSVYSPFFDLTGITNDVYLSFYHSIHTEPNWDRSLFQYSVDSGKTWITAGGLNDPNGVNWYNESVYQNAAGNADCFCFPAGGCIENLIFSDGTNVKPAWTSNGDCEGDDATTGPFGWVWAQYKFSAASNFIQGKKMVRFRYISWSDFGSYIGWAFDGFKLGLTTPTFTGKIDGIKFLDYNSNGVYDVGPNEPLESGVGINLFYFGVHSDSTTTDVNGYYKFENLKPGTYTVIPSVTGIGFSIPSLGVWEIDHDGISTVEANFGQFLGSISGKKFQDRNDNGVEDPTELGLPGYMIEVRLDSANGEFLTSAITDENGEYTIYLPNGTYYVDEILAENVRQTFPTNGEGYLVTLSGNSGSPTANLTGKDFGDFILAEITCLVTQDRDGNGVVDPPDGVALPLGTARINIDVYKNYVWIATDVLSDGVGSVIHRNLDRGVYTFVRSSPVPAGHIETRPALTNPPELTDALYMVEVHVDTCNTVAKANFLYFKLVTVSGVKFDDKNGDGSNAGDTGADGWKIKITGSMYGPDSAITAGGGNYAITGVGPGSHTVSETMLNSDWLQTFPTSPNTYTFTAVTASQSGDQTGKNFGNFKKFCVSGVKFRDRDNDGVMDEGEEPLAGWTMNLTGQTPIVTGEDGAFEWCGLLPGTYTLNETAQEGWTATTPTGGTITFDGVSGLAQVIPFGNFQGTDDIKYRTFTYEQLADCGQQKKLKAPSVKAPASKPWYAPTMMTVVDQLVGPTAKGGYAAYLQVGESGKTYPWGKVAPYLLPAKYGDVSKTFVDCKKARIHIAPSQPFNTTNKGGTMAKRYKSIPPKTQDNKLTAELLTLQVNLALSDKGFTPTGLGAVIYPGTGPWGTNVSFDVIETFANRIMTNWVPGMISPSPVNPTDYDALYDAVRAINLAFASASIVDTTVDGGWRSTHFKYEPMKSATEAGFLAATAAPKARPVGTPEETPDAYALSQNYPNPFNPTTTLSFDLPSDAIVTLKIYNLLGQEIATILDREEYASGTYEERFDASQLASGVYLYRIVSEEITDDGSTGQSFMQVKKMVLMK